MQKNLNAPIHVNESNCVLKILQEHDSTDNYLRWLNDSELMKYTESTSGRFTKLDASLFIRKCLASPDIFLWGIFIDGNHIGNIKLGPIIARENRASLGLIVGDKNFQGKGIATNVIGATTRFAETVLRLSRLTAGVLGPNVASLKAFERNGFVVESRERNYRMVDNEWVDRVILGRRLGSL